MSTTSYDLLYKQFNLIKEPYGYSKNYIIWRESKIKGEISKFIKESKGLILDLGGGFGLMANFLPSSILDSYINLDISIVMLKYSPIRMSAQLGSIFHFETEVLIM
jgi:hypothetical protein